MNKSTYSTQNDLLLKNLMEFYEKAETEEGDTGTEGGGKETETNFDKMLKIITGESKISLRIIDWFVTNYSKKHYTIFVFEEKNNRRFKIYDDYKLKLKAYSKKRFDVFCRFQRIELPYKNCHIETTIGQLNFFKWALENKIIDYIDKNYELIEKDMNCHKSVSKKREIVVGDACKTRKKREELSVSATKSIKKEKVEIVVQFN